MHQEANLYGLFTPTPLPMGFRLGLVNRRHQQKIRRQKKRSGYFFPASRRPGKGCDPSLRPLPPRGPSSSALSLGSVTTSSSCPFALEVLLASHCSWCLGALSLLFAFIHALHFHHLVELKSLPGPWRTYKVGIILPRRPRGRVVPVHSLLS